MKNYKRLYMWPLMLCAILSSEPVYSGWKDFECSFHMPNGAPVKIAPFNWKYERVAAKGEMIFLKYAPSIKILEPRYARGILLKRRIFLGFCAANLAASAIYYVYARRMLDYATRDILYKSTFDPYLFEKTARRSWQSRKVWAFEAIRAGNSDALSYFLTKGVSPNATDSMLEGTTLLVSALERKQYGCAQVLLQAGADPWKISYIHFSRAVIRPVDYIGVDSATTELLEQACSASRPTLLDKIVDQLGKLSGKVVELVGGRHD